VDVKEVKYGLKKGDLGIGNYLLELSCSLLRLLNGYLAVFICSMNV
jgi:hypothetical protein